MKNIAAYIIVLFLADQLSARPINPVDTSIENLLKYYVTNLAHDSMQGRATGTIGMFKAAEFIAAEMKSSGLKRIAGTNGYFQYFDTGVEKVTGINVIGVLEGDSLKDEIVIICAHFDHLGIARKYKEEDSIYNGANDNASGTAAVLLLASKLQKAKLKRTIFFIAFSGEEMGLLGSNLLASQVDPAKIKAVINFEMLGIPQGNQAYITGASYGNFYGALNKELWKKNPEKYGKTYYRKSPESKKLFNRSDNYSFALNGIPAYTIYATDDTDVNYHQLSDETETLNFPFMSEVVEAAYIAIQPILNGTVKLKTIKVW